MSISRVPEPSEDGRKCPFLRRVNEPGQIFEAVALASMIFWIVTHFDLKKSRTFPCLAARGSIGEILDNTECERCKLEYPVRKRGYLHVWSVKDRREEFLEITPTTWCFAKMAWPMLSTLRGWRITAVRGKGRTARLSLTLQEPWHAQDLSKLPEEKTPEECLENTMRI